MPRRGEAPLGNFRERADRAIQELTSEIGPGVVTGAADDDPSGIATYSQAGAQFGYGLLWTMLLTYPLMAAVASMMASAIRFEKAIPNKVSTRIR